MLEEISKVAAEVAKRKGATLLFDKAGPTAIGISNVIFADPGFDITDDVMKEVNKDRPAGAPAASAAGGTTGSGAPAVSVPGLGGTKK
jgi:outer membrane protein